MRSSLKNALSCYSFMPKALTLLLALSLLASGCARQRPPSEQDDGKVTVVASIAPLAYFAQRVGGDQVHVEMLIPPGYSPHTFELKPEQMRLLSRAKLLVLNGIGLELWADDLVGAASYPELKVVKTAEGLALINLSGHEHDHSGNPHVWLDPIYAIYQVEKIKNALIEVDPAGAEGYQLNSQALIADLRNLDAEIKATVADFKFKRFISQHAAWTYFAKRYGLVEAAVIETKPGREPSPGEIADIIQTIKKTGARAVFAEPQLSQKAALAIASETNAEVVLINPLGRPPDYDYLATMRYNLAQMKEGLG